MTEDVKKTLMNEVLPTPSPAPSTSPRARAQKRLEGLAKKAALAGAATTLSACVGYGVVDPIPQPAQCTQNDSLDAWAFASFFGTGVGTQITLNVSLNNFEVTGVRLSNEFLVEGGTRVGQPQFDGTALATSTNVNVTIQPDDGATTIIVHTGFTCDDDPRAVEVRIDLLNGVATLVDAG